MLWTLWKEGAKHRSMAADRPELGRQCVTATAPCLPRGSFSPCKACSPSRPTRDKAGALSWPCHRQRYVPSCCCQRAIPPSFKLWRLAGVGKGGDMKRDKAWCWGKKDSKLGEPNFQIRMFINVCHWPLCKLKLSLALQAHDFSCLPWLFPSL